MTALEERGVRVIDPRQTYIDADVRPERICAGAVLHPGTRLSGPRTFLGPDARVGTEGPATLVNSVLGQRAAVASGFLEGAVLLRDAKAGANNHLRGGTLLEEEASTAHAVGLKQTILMSFVTVGSLVNFCDALVAGGTSRADHSEIGSGYIHYNFTPWGRRGDKATPTLVGDVVRGVFLRERRIFLGGSGGIVGPRTVGYGTIAAAGQIVRKDVPDGRLVHQGVREFDHEHDPQRLDPVEPRRTKNLAYIGQLRALAAWYHDVRLRRIPSGPDLDHLRVTTEAALQNIEAGVAERTRRLEAFLAERGEQLDPLPADRPACPLAIEPSDPHVDHVEWVQRLGEGELAKAKAWLQAVAAGR